MLSTTRELGALQEAGHTDAEEARRRDSESWAMSCAREGKQLTEETEKVVRLTEQLNQL